jgi:cellulose biosynthesis protein BcsQ
MKTIAFFNNKGGVGKTTLVNHLAWMFHELGLRLVLLDLDPQANLTASFLDDLVIEPLLESDPPRTILGAVRPLLDRLGDVDAPYVCDIAPGLWLVAGDPGLSDFEDRLSDAWTHCLDDNRANRADGQRVVTAFHRIAGAVARDHQADLVLLDLGPALSPLNRSALVASDCVVVPVGADLFSLRGLINLGPRLREWRAGWRQRGGGTGDLPPGAMDPVGYVVLSHGPRHNLPTRAYDYWAEKLPGAFARAVKGENEPTPRTAENDPWRLATMRNYMSLMPLAQAARKPVFALTARDGALGAHGEAVTRAHRDFESLARRIALACGVPLPR